MCGRRLLTPRPDPAAATRHEHPEALTLPHRTQPTRPLPTFKSRAISGVPDWVADLASLRCLGLEYDYLTALPRQLQQMPQLRELKLYSYGGPESAGDEAVSALQQACNAPDAGGGSSMATDGAMERAASISSSSGGVYTVGLHTLEVTTVALCPLGRASVIQWIAQLRWLVELSLSSCPVGMVPEGLPVTLEVRVFYAWGWFGCMGLGLVAWGCLFTACTACTARHCTTKPPHLPGDPHHACMPPCMHARRGSICLIPGSSSCPPTCRA